MRRTSPSAPPPLATDPAVELVETHEGRIARLVLRGLQGNALDVRMVEQLERAVDALAGWPELAAVVIEGSGADFCTGLLPAQRRAPYAQILVPTWHRVLRKLASLDALLVAQVRGRCLGAGLELALVCERIASDPTGRFGVPELAQGAFAPAATLLLPLRVGGAAADELLFSATPIDAEEAKARGLVTELAGGWDSVAEVSAGIVQRLVLPRSTTALRAQVRARRRPVQQLLADELSTLEEQLLAHLARSPDAEEGLTAHAQGRAPRWRHQ